MRFHKQEIIDGRINKSMLDEKRDKDMSAKDIREAFQTMLEFYQKNNSEWHDIYWFIYSRIRSLKNCGCDMRHLESAFDYQEHLFFDRVYNQNSITDTRYKPKKELTH